MEGHVWLVGMMGSGKSVTARALASRLGVRAIDTDAEVARKAECSVADLWSERGEEAFRSLEAAAVGALADHPPAVIATGGGVVLDDGNVTRMRASGRVIWLEAQTEVLVARVGNGGSRPLLNDGDPTERLGAIAAGRRARYAAAADFVIDTSGLSVAETADRIEAWLGES
jgi:shikimate kinase